MQATPHTCPVLLPGVWRKRNGSKDGGELWFPTGCTGLCGYHGSFCPSRPHLQTCPSPHREVLSIFGARFDIIIVCGIPCVRLEPSVASLVRYLEEALQTAKSLAPYCTGESPMRSAGER